MKANKINIIALIGLLIASIGIWLSYSSPVQAQGQEKEMRACYTVKEGFLASIHTSPIYMKANIKRITSHETVTVTEIDSELGWGKTLQEEYIRMFEWAPCPNGTRHYEAPPTRTPDPWAPPAPDSAPDSDSAPAPTPTPGWLQRISGAPTFGDGEWVCANEFIQKRFFLPDIVSQPVGFYNPDGEYDGTLGPKTYLKIGRCYKVVDNDSGVHESSQMTRIYVGYYKFTWVPNKYLHRKK